jgi:6-phosphogluconolactonase
MSEVAVVRDAAEVARAAAELFVEAVCGAYAARGRAAVALTGGSSASPLFAELRSARWASKIPWTDVQFFFSDERAVPHGDPLSNFGLAERELLSSTPVAPDQIHRLRGEAKDLGAEASRAAAELRQTLGTPPRLDLMLLGLGPDGHILSLFAGVPGSADRGDDELVRAVAPPTQVEPKVARLTLTPFLVVSARNLVLQVTGAKKAPVLARTLKGPEDLVACPAQWLRKASGRVVIVSDPEAASAL